MHIQLRMHIRVPISHMPRWCDLTKTTNPKLSNVRIITDLIYTDWVHPEDPYFEMWYNIGIA